MPKIPRFYSERLPPGTTGLVAPSPRMMTMEAEAWGGVGKQISETAQLAARVFGKIAQDNLNLAIESKSIEAENFINTRVFNISRDFNFRTDWDKFDSDTFIDNEIQKIRSELEEKRITKAFSWEGGEVTERKVRNATEKALNKYSIELRKISALKRNQFLTDKMNLEFGKLYDEAQNRYIEETDPEIRKAIKTELEMKSLAVGSEYALNLMKGFDEDIEKGELIHLISTNPKEALKAIKERRFKTISKKELSVFEKAAIEEDKKLQRELDEKKVTDVYMGLKTKRGKMYDLMLAELLSPEFQKKYDLSIEQVSKIENQIKSEWNVEEGIKKKKYEETARKWFLKLDGLTLDEINKDVATDNASVQMGEEYRNRVLNPTDIKTNPNEYVSILKDIEEGIKPKEEISSKILSSKLLSIEDKKSLGNKLFGREDKVNNSWLSDSRKYLESQIVPKRGAFEKIIRTPKEEKDLYDAYKVLDESLEKAKREGKPIEGRDIYDLAVEIASTPRFKKSLAERIIEMQESMKEVPSELKRLKDISKKGEKYKTAEEVRDAFNVNELTFEDAEAILKQKFKRK